MDFPHRKSGLRTFIVDRIRGENDERAPARVLGPFREWLSGGVLLSHPVSRAVPSALRGLASGFGMGPGVSLSLWPPKLS